jgi:hypothetical protein
MMFAMTWQHVRMQKAAHAATLVTHVSTTNMPTQLPSISTRTCTVKLTQLTCFACTKEAQFTTCSHTAAECLHEHLLSLSLVAQFICFTSTKVAQFTYFLTAVLRIHVAVVVSQSEVLREGGARGPP